MEVGQKIKVYTVSRNVTMGKRPTKKAQKTVSIYFVYFVNESRTQLF